jgi:hypothetical protein
MIKIMGHGYHCLLSIVATSVTFQVLEFLNQDLTVLEFLS